MKQILTTFGCMFFGLPCAIIGFITFYIILGFYAGYEKAQEYLHE